MTDGAIGKRVGEALRTRQLNQSQLATKVGTSGATISRVIAGKLGLSVELAEQIAGITGVGAGWRLIGELTMRRGQDLNAVAEASYLAGWQDAIANAGQQLREMAKQGPKGSSEVSPPRGSPARLAAAKRHLQELEARGLVRPRAAPPARRRKRA